MRISKQIRKSAIQLDMKATGKQEALSEMVDLLCGAYKLKEKDTILDAIREREKKQSTGIGVGLAVPHAKTPAVGKLFVAFGLSREGIDFESIDGEKANLFFMLVSPRDVSGPHIKALAGISRLIKHEEVRNSLLECGSVKGFMELIAKAEEKFL